MSSDPPNPDPVALDLLPLLERARGGDRAAVDQLFAEYYPRVERQVHRALTTDVRNGRPWLSARFSTADIVQETFLGALRDLGAFEGRTEASFTGYLTMIVRNRILDALRYHEAERRDARRGSSAAAAADGLTGDDDPAESASLRDEMRAYLEALETLPERERLLLRARFEGTATFEDLTEILGYSSVTTTRRAFALAKARVADRLGARLGREESDHA